MNRRVFTYTYNQQFNPAMPVVEVGLSLLQQGTPTTNIVALVDSGSDITLVPLDVLESIGAKPIDKARIRGRYEHGAARDSVIHRRILVKSAFLMSLRFLAMTLVDKDDSLK